MIMLVWVGTSASVEMIASLGCDVKSLAFSPSPPHVNMKGT